MNSAAHPPQELRTLAASALLGSDRAGPGGESAMALLTKAAAAGVRTRAGRLCRVTVRAIEECPVESRPLASVSQVSTLERLLAAPDAALLREWCGLACERGVRPHPALIPAMLEWWSRQPVRPPEVFEATGACGVWLASLRGEWRKPVATSEIPDDAETMWQTGTSAHRLALLTTVRRVDAARAMEMVRSTWAADGAEERRKCVEVLAQGVTRADEEFLEAALDDRSKTVRREAARALAMLKGSKLRERMRERAMPTLVIERVKSGASARGSMKLSIQPPMSFEKAWERDGLEEQPAAGKGKRAFWLAQIVTGTDLSAWTQASGLVPADVMSAIQHDEFLDVVRAAMVASLVACSEQDHAGEWADAMVDVGTASSRGDAALLTPLWCSRPREQSESMRLRCVSSVRGAAAWNVLASDERPWSAGFSMRAAEMLRERAPAKAESWDYWSAIEAVSKLIHPTMAEVFEGVIGGMFPEGVSESVGKSLDRIRLRAQMHREFAL